MSHNATITDEFTFIIDSGATSHMIPWAVNTVDVLTIYGRVHLGNQEVMNILGLGNSNIPIVKDMLLVPGLMFSIISVSQLDKIGCSTIINKGKTIVRDVHNKIVLTDSLDNNLYFLNKIYILIV